MSDELIIPDNLSKEVLKSIFDAALMDTSYDNDGDLVVKEQVRCVVLLSKSNDRISYVTLFGFNPEVPQSARLECANRINSELIVVKAIVGNNNILRFEYDILVSGGISKKAIVLTLRRFCSIPRAAVSKFAEDLIE
ncbi:MAG: YbjN domain-containing protein [Planctomycetota bacterium]